MSVNIQIVTVVNDFAQYDRYVKNNPFYKNCDLISFDNTKENISIPVRYNNFIDNRMLPDTWVIFCHQDFSMKEDVGLKLKDLDKGCIYGAVGIKDCRWREVAFRVTGPNAFRFEKRGFFERIQYGRILQGVDDDESKAILMGEKVTRPYEVDTVDSCCLILHASLIRKHALRFDARFDFNLFAADLSIMARKRYDVRTKILQLDCFHLSQGRRTAGYFRCLSHLIEKHPDEKIALTFSDAEEVAAFKYVLLNKNSAEIIKGFAGSKEVP